MNKGYKLNKEDILSLDFKMVFTGLKPADNIGRKKALEEVFAKEPDENKKEMLAFFVGTCSMTLRNGQLTPYVPVLRFDDGTTSFNLYDITEENLDTLAEVYGSISDIYLKARVADILWFKRRNYEAAVIAIDLFMELSAEIAFPKDGINIIRIMGRAIDVAASLGLKNEFLPKCISHVKSLVDAYKELQPTRYHWDLLELIEKYEDSKYLIEIFEPIAERSLEYDLNIAINLHNKLAELYKKAKYETSYSKSLKKIASLHESQATEYFEKGNAAAAAHNITQAIKALRKTSGFKDDIDQLHAKLISYQAKRLETIHTFSTGEFDISELVKEAQAFVSNKSPEEALYSFSRLIYPITKKELESYIAPEETPILSMISKTIVGDKGQTIKQVSGLEGKDFKGNPEAYEFELKQCLIRLQDLYAKAYVYPAIIQVSMEHNISTQLLYRFLCNNPLVDEDQIKTYIIGFRNLFELRTIEAACILTPLLESSLRHLLAGLNKITSKLTSTFTQPEIQLEELLNNKLIVEKLGEDFIFELKSTFIDKDAVNYRNRLCHGNISDDELLAYRTIYACWLIFKLVMLPVGI